MSKMFLSNTLFSPFFPLKKHFAYISFFLFLFTALFYTLSYADDMSSKTVESGTVSYHSSYGNKYIEMKNKLKKGWNTWDTNSLLTYVLLPEGFTLKMKVRNSETGDVLERALIGRRGKDEEKVKPGYHAYNGEYTDMEVEWRGIRFSFQTVSKNDDISIIITPLADNQNAYIVLQPAFLYGKTGSVSYKRNALNVRSGKKKKAFNLFGTVNQDNAEDGNIVLSLSLAAPIGISTKYEDFSLINESISKAKSDFAQNKLKYGELSEIYNAMQSVLAWNVIYEPTKDRVITPVSRAWSIGWGGYVLFCWDTYFASYMLSLDNKELAYANAIEITKEITSSGFVPNFAGGTGSSLDRSQPPVGSFVIREIYRHYREKWFLEEVYDDLLTWNKWWEKNRVTKGLLCWGSNPYKGYMKDPSAVMNVNQRMGAALESGLDNSPMYDGMAFNAKTHQMMLADVGLTSLYVMDCDALADIASVLGKTGDEKELRAKATLYRNNLSKLWDNEKGFYFNRKTNDDQVSYRISPTNFYPFLAHAPTQSQAKRMINEHFYNKDEFWGEWILPSISRNDADFSDNEYWRGRIWAPMNFLVYLGMRNYGLSDARRDLTEKSADLLLKSWMGERHVFENYNSVNGIGDDVGSSDMFYHWGALLGFISLIEKGFVPSPEINL